VAVPDAATVANRDEFRRGLAAIRSEAGLTIREVAAKANVPFSTVGGYFSGRHLPTPAQLEQFVRVLNACGVTQPAEVDAWLDAVRRVRRALGRPVPGRAPYRGLAAFQPEDSEWFFGRESLTQALLERVSRSDDGLLMVVGPSGSGKSSLLRAGLAGSAECAGDSPRWRYAVLTPGVEPLHTLREHLDQADVLMVDQFEEVFTQCRDEEQRRTFIEALHSASQRVVIGMRADFYAHALRYPRLAGALQRNQLVVGPMTEEELRRAIVEPARRARIELDGGLVELLIRDLAPATPCARAAHDAGALPLLSHALLATWEHGDKGRMSVEDYRATGGIDGAVARTAEAVYVGLSETQRQAARRMFLRLVHIGEGIADTRRRAAWAELFGADGAEDAEFVLDQYVSRRLVTADADTVEISHEALLSAWPRLRGWVDADRARIRVHRQLTEAARAWRDGARDPGALHRGARLAAATEWAGERSHRADLNPLEHEFLDASIAQDAAERERERIRTRRLFRLSAALSVLVLVAATLTGYAFWQRAESEREANLALSRQVAATANRIRGSDPALAAQLSLAAYRVAPTVEARSSLLASSMAPRVTRMVRPGGAQQSVAISPDGRLVAAAGAAKTDTSILLWNLPQPTRPTRVGEPLTAHRKPIYAVTFSPDGHILATGSADNTVRLWNVTDAAHVTEFGAPLTGFTERVLATAFSPDGTLLAAGGADQVLQLWQVTDPAHPVAVGQGAGAGGAIQAVTFRPDGRYLATADAAGAMQL
jgi:transcriptional regulator with XRE-family HTH domain